jgi:hypothetical protein
MQWLLRWLRLSRGLKLSDPPCETLEEIEPHDATSVSKYIRSVLGQVVAQGFEAVCLFYHEEDDCVRVCLWHSKPSGFPGPAWFEEVPISGTVGKSLLDDLRRRVVSRRRIGDTVTGRLMYRWRGCRGHFVFESPHAWEVRLFTSERRPPYPAYSLRFAELDRDQGAPDAETSRRGNRAPEDRGRQ